MALMSALSSDFQCLVEQDCLGTKAFCSTALSDVRLCAVL